MEQIRVLMIGPARNVHGGISAVVNNYYKAGLQKKIKLTYIGTMEDGSKVHKLLVAVKAVFQYLFRVGKCDIVHVNMASDVSFYRKRIFIQIAAIFKKKIIIHQHGGDFEGFYSSLSERKQRKVRQTLNQAEKMLVIAPYLKELFSQMICEDKIIVMPDSVFVYGDREKDYKNQNILFLGRICKEKGIRELISAVEGIRDSYQECHLILGGSFGDEETRVLAESKQNFVEMAGWLDDKGKQTYLDKCSIFALPSYFEGQSVALLEAMEAGCACVASNIGGIPQMIRDNENGLFIVPESTQSLQAGLEMVLESEVRRKTLGRKARETVQESFNLEKNIETLLEIYQSVMS